VELIAAAMTFDGAIGAVGAGVAVVAWEVFVYVEFPEEFAARTR